MKATLINLTLFITLVAVGFTTPVKADIEAVSAFVTHIEAKSQQLESSHRSDSNKVTSEYAEEILDDLDKRLTSQFEGVSYDSAGEQVQVGQAEQTDADGGLKADAIFEELELAAR